ncbi:MAG: SPOR domain-containing protein [Gammaproteobacteria bacterium]
MEIGLKERLIGAVVLVILAVIIIPWVLKGSSAPDTTVTKSLTLPPAAVSSGQSAYHLDLNNPAVTGNASMPAVTTTHGAQPGIAPVAKPAMRPAPAPTAHTATSTGGWVVQAGSYSNEANARSVQSKIAKQGYHSYISRFHKGNRTFYRVRVGPYTDRASAERVVSGVGHAYGGRAVVVPNS